MLYELVLCCCLCFCVCLCVFCLCVLCLRGVVWGCIACLFVVVCMFCLCVLCYVIRGRAVFVTSGWCMVCWCVNKVWCFCVFVFVRLKVCVLLVNYCVMLYGSLLVVRCRLRLCAFMCMSDVCVMYCVKVSGLLFVVCVAVACCVCLWVFGLMRLCVVCDLCVVLSVSCVLVCSCLHGIC